MKVLKSTLKVIVIILAVAVAVFLLYAGYVFLSYHRIEDGQALEINTIGSPTQTMDTSKNYRISSYNVGFGAYSSDFSFFMDGGEHGRAYSEDEVRKNTVGASNVIANLNPDMELFQEVDTDGDRSCHVNEQALISNSLNLPNCDMIFAQNYDSPFIFYPLYEPHGKNQSGLLTISKYSCSDAVRYSLPVQSGFKKIFDLDRCFEKQYINVTPDKKLALYNLHLSAYADDRTVTEGQINILVQDMLQEYNNGNYAIAGGDFNRDLLQNSSQVFNCIHSDATYSLPFPKELIPQNLTLVAPLDTDNPVATSRLANEPYEEGCPTCLLKTLDGFIISDNVEKISTAVVDTDFEYSDHNPIYMDFAFKS